MPTALRMAFGRIMPIESSIGNSLVVYILAPSLSDFTKRLYRSVLKTFCDWALVYQNIDDKELSSDQKVVKKGLRLISTQSLKEIAAIKVKTSTDQHKRYHKDSLNEKQRYKFLNLCQTPRDRAFVSLMAWNGLRTIEVIRSKVLDCHFKEKRLSVWGKGRSSKNKDVIKFLDIPIKEIKIHLRTSGIKSGKLFPLLTKLDIENVVRRNFKIMGLLQKNTKYSPHSLRHTAGQIMYDKGIPIEFIQRHLRHSTPATTLVYAQRAVDRNYFKKLPGNT